MRLTDNIYKRVKRIKRKVIITVFIFICIAFLLGCTKEHTFADYFHSEMEENKKEYDEEVNYSYTLVHQEQNVAHENDAIAIFTENNLQGEQIFIAYFEKEKGNWNWKQTRGAEWDTPVQWSSMHEVPYIYSGAIRDDSIVEVYAGEESAKIIDVEGEERFWYAISNVKNVEVKVIKDDSTQEVIEEIDEQMLEDWEK